MQMLMFDFRDSEKEFFNANKLNDFDITFFEGPLNENTKLSEEQFNDTVVISVFTTSNITQDVLKKFKNLRVLATRSSAIDHIDIDYCTQFKIAVLNIEQYEKNAVAEFALGLILSLVRNIIPAYYDMKNHTIDYPKYEGRVLSSYKLGIIGGSPIGSAVAKIAHFLGMKVLVSSYMKDSEISEICEFVSFDELIKEADIISLHAHYDGENYHLLGKEEFESMKEGVYIINTARGELIDTKVLYDNLVKGKVKGAALDVLECEFLNNYKGEISGIIEKSETNCVENALITQKLFKMENVILTPHIAYNTTETVSSILNTTFNSIRDFLKGENTNRVC